MLLKVKQLSCNVTGVTGRIVPGKDISMNKYHLKYNIG